MSLERALDRYLDQERLYSTEGRRGVESLCQIVRALGYTDPMYFGQLSSKAVLGDFICFLEDNPGAIQAIITWIGEQRSSEWEDQLESQIATEDDEEENDDEE